MDKKQNKRTKTYRFWVEVPPAVRKALEEQAEREKRSVKAQAEYILIQHAGNGNGQTTKQEA